MARIGYNEIKRMNDRREKRKQNLAKVGRWLSKKGWKIFLVVAVLGVAIWQGWFWIRKFNPAELRTLKTIDITGNRMLTWEEILQTAGLETGMPMSAIYADSVRNRLLSLPLLQDAKVDVGMFWKVTIDVEETTPIMETLDKGQWKAYSGRGLVLPIAASAGLELPVATIARNREIKQIASFLQKMRSADEALYKEVSQVAVDEKKHAMEVFFRNVRFKVLFPLENVTEKSFHHYRLLVDGLSQEMSSVKSLDLRFEGFAYAYPSAKEVK
jgi:cell division protein FtsQ